MPAVLLSPAAAHDSLPGHMELLWLQVCSLTPSARFSHDISRPGRPAAGSLPCPPQRREPSALGTSRQPGRRRHSPAAPPLRYRLPWNATIPQAPGETRVGDVPAARPGPRRLFQMHLLGPPRGLPQPAGRLAQLTPQHPTSCVTLSKSCPLSRPQLFQL